MELSEALHIWTHSIVLVCLWFPYCCFFLYSRWKHLLLLVDGTLWQKCKHIFILFTTNKCNFYMFILIIPFRLAVDFFYLYAPFILWNSFPPHPRRWINRIWHFRCGNEQFTCFLYEQSSVAFILLSHIWMILIVISQMLLILPLWLVS